MCVEQAYSELIHTYMKTFPYIYIYIYIYIHIYIYGKYIEQPELATSWISKGDPFVSHGLL